MAFLFPGIRGIQAAKPPIPFDSIVFDGTSMLSNTDYHPEISGTGAQYTIALLVKVSDVSNLQCIASFGQTTSNQYRTVGIDPNGGDPRFFGGSGATYRRLGSTSIVPEVGKWYGITLTMQSAGNGQNLQVNGSGLDSTGSDGNLTGARSHSTNGICTLGGRYGSNDLFTGEVGMFLVSVDPHYLSAHLKWLQNNPYSILPSAVRTDTVINLLDQNRLWSGSNIVDTVGSHFFPVTSGVTNSNDTIPDGGYSIGWVNDGSWEGDGVADGVHLIDNYNPTTEIGTGDFSVVIRFKSDNVTVSQSVFSWVEDSASADGYLIVNINTSKCRLYFRRQGTSNNDYVEFATTLSNDTWYTLVIARTGVTIDAWLNGTDHVDETDNLGTDSGLSFATDFNADNHNLGRHRNGFASTFLDGHLCQYAIFNNRLLTADEAEVIHGGGVPHDLTTDRTYNSKTYTADPATLDLYALLNTGIENGSVIRTGLLVNRGSSNNLIGVNAGGTWSVDYPS